MAMPKKRKKQIEIEEYDHAILVRGTGSIDEAREALKQDGWNKATRRLPCRPFYNEEFGGACVAFYFEVGAFQ